MAASEGNGVKVVIVGAGAAQEPGESRPDLIHRNSRICRSIMGQVLERIVGGVERQLLAELPEDEREALRASARTLIDVQESIAD